MQERAVPVIVPTLLWPEVAATVGRGHRDGELARRFVSTLRQLSHLVVIPVDETLALQTTDVAARHGLRGSDAVYAAVALRFGSTLVTMDREQRERVAAVVRARQPAEAVAEWPER